MCIHNRHFSSGGDTFYLVTLGDGTLVNFTLNEYRQAMEGLLLESFTRTRTVLSTMDNTRRITAYTFIQDMKS